VENTATNLVTDALSLRSLYLYFLSEEAIGDVTNISLCVTSALKR